MVAMNPKVIKEAICLWIDGIGGYAMCSAEGFQFGSAASNSADASVFADIPANAFSIATVQESTILTPEVNGVSVNGRSIERPCILKHLDRIEILGRVGLLYRRPNPLSQTAMLTLLTRHRWNHHVDGVVLMSHCCVIGGTTKAHIFNPHSDKEWLLTRESNQWFIAARSAMEPQGGPMKQLLMPMRRFKGDGIQLTLAVERIEY